MNTGGTGVVKIVMSLTAYLAVVRSMNMLTKLLP